jgi:hypothetical protein
MYIGLVGPDLNSEAGLRISCQKHDDRREAPIGVVNSARVASGYSYGQYLVSIRVPRRPLHR